MKSWTTLALSIVAVVFAAYSGYLSMENKRLKRLVSQTAQEGPSLANTSAETEELMEVAIEAVEEEEGRERSRRRPELEEFENMSPEERREVIADRRREARAAQLERTLAVFDDPELRMDMIERQMERLDRGYAEFFKRLGLPAEEIDALKTLMAERNLIRMESGIRASAASEDDRQAVRDAYKEQYANLSADIDALLGEENAAKFKHYSNTLQYRGDVDSFERALSYSDSPLTNRQAEGLVNVFAKVDNDFEYSVDLSELQGRGGRGRDDVPVTQEMIDTYYQEREIYDAMLLEQAATVLNESQLASLAAQQISEREREQRQAQLALENAQTSDVPGGGFRRGGGFGGGFGGRRGGGDGGR